MATNFFGNFLQGYVKGREQKQQQRRQDADTEVNQAMKWSQIADTTKHDDIRELATRNMQQHIINYEKIHGEKQGLGSILKMFGHHGKDAPALLNKIAPELSKEVDVPTAPMGTDVVDNSSKNAISGMPPVPGFTPAELESGGTPDTRKTESEAAQPFTAGFNDEQSKMLGIAPQSTIAPQAANAPIPMAPAAAPEAQVAAPEAAAQTVSAPGQTRVDNRYRAQDIARAATPGRSLFQPDPTTGRFSKTNKEIFEEQRQERIQEYKDKQSADIENASKMYQVQKDLTDKDKADKIAKVDSDPNMSPEMKAEYKRQINLGPLQHLDPTRVNQILEERFSNGKYETKNGYGEWMNRTHEIKAQEPVAWEYLNVQEGTKDIEAARKSAAEEAQGMRKWQKQMQQAQIDMEKSKGKYYTDQAQHWADEIKNVQDTIRDKRQSTIREEISKAGTKFETEELKGYLGAIANIGGEFREKEFKKKQDGPDARRDEKGRKFQTIDEWKDWYLSKALGANVAALRYAAATGVDPSRVYVKGITESLGLDKGSVEQIKSKDSTTPSGFNPNRAQRNADMMLGQSGVPVE